MAFFEARLDLMAPEVRPAVGYFCQMAPYELIASFGAIPIRLGCGNAALVQSGEEVLSGEICPLTKSSFAAFLEKDGLPEHVECVVVPTSCDAKKKLGEVLSDYKPVFMLNLPPEQDYSRFGDAAVAELERLSEFLAKHLKRKFDRRELQAQIELGRKRSLIVREFQELRSRSPECLSVRDLFIIIQASTTPAPLSPWLTEARKALEEARTFVSDRPRLRPRLVLTGAPIIWPNFKPLNLIEESGADVVADTLCSGAQSLIDPVVLNETSTKALLRALAQKYIFASPCPCFVSSATRISRVLDLAASCKADGVLHYGLRLCQLFDIEVYRLSSVLKENKIPFMNLRTDYSLEDTEQLRVRLEAFLETLEGEAQ
jgi:benzoyl-CoA reductase/2-hydroxyglutaryl-CoA dehydratase subunit BcrC/BadD/HgdB